MGKSTVALGMVLLGVACCTAGHIGHGHGGGDAGFSAGGDVGYGGGAGGSDGGHGGHHDQGWGWSHPKYKYSYGVKDSKTWDQKEAAEWRDGDSVKGHYSLLEPTGHWRTVHYTADKGGFKAHVTRTHGKSL